MLCWQGRELDIVNQAEVTDTFRAVREDLGRVAKAYTVLEVVDQLAQERHANPRLYDMVVGALRALEADDAPLLVPAFCLKVLALEGSAPVRRRVRVVRRPPTTSSPSTSSRAACCAGRAGGAGPCRPRPSSCCAGSSAGAWPRRWPSPTGPLAGEVTELATEAMEVHLDRRLRSVPRRGPTAVTTGRAVEPTEPFGVYVHVPVLRVALRLLRLRHLDRPRPPDGGLRRGLRDRARGAPVADEGLPPATSVFVGGGTPSRLPAEPAGRGPRAPWPAPPGAEVTVECNPEDASAERFAALARRRGDPGLVRGAVDGPPRARRPGPPPRHHPGGPGRRPWPARPASPR